MSSEPTMRDLFIGRVGFDIPLYEVSSWSNSGGQTQITGRIGFNSPLLKVPDAITARQQLLALLDNPDEPVVPLRYPPDPTLDGFYYVDDVKVSLDASNEAPYDEGRWRFEIALRGQRSQAPILEITHIGNVRTNAHAITSGDPLNGFPTSAEMFFDSSGFQQLIRTGDTGAMSVGIAFVGYGAAARFRARCSVDPANFYVGAATIERSTDSGTTWRNVVGRQVALSDVTAGGGNGWRISNNLVRVRSATTAGNLPGIGVSHHDGTQWETEKIYRLDPALAGNTYSMAPGAVILRNTPEMVTVRMCASLNNTANYSGAAYIDLSLARGDRIVRGVISSQLALLWIVVRNTAEASTAITPGGVRATANDAGGNRFVLLTSKAKSNDLVNGGIQMSAPTTQFDFGIGTSIGGSGAAGGETTDHIAEQYWWAGNLKQRVVTR